MVSPVIPFIGENQVSRNQKLLDKIRRNPKNVSLHDFETLINCFGHVEGGGKHPKAIIGTYTMPYKPENPVKSCYVKDILEIIKSIEG